MQINELYRRGLVVGITDEAESQLMLNNIDRHTLVKVCRFPDDEYLFMLLWERGFFQTINQKLGVMIDDYEEEVIESNQVTALLQTMRQFGVSDHLSAAETDILSEMIALCEFAIKHKKSIFFIL